MSSATVTLKQLRTIVSRCQAIYNNETLEFVIHELVGCPNYLCVTYPTEKLLIFLGLSEDTKFRGRSISPCGKVMVGILRRFVNRFDLIDGKFALECEVRTKVFEETETTEVVFIPHIDPPCYILSTEPLL